MRAGLALAVALLGLAACQRQAATRAPCPAGEVCLEYGVSSEPFTLDPQKANLVEESNIIADLIVGLTTDGPDGQPVPGMATSWETSADGLTWTFHLREAQWSDGVPVTANDYVYGLQRILDPKTASIYGYMAYLLKNGRQVGEGELPPSALGVRALDDRTLEFRLEHPAPYLAQLTKHQSFFPAPRHVVEKYGDAWVRPEHYVGNGPFKLTAWRLGDRIQVEKNPRFYDAQRVCVNRINYYPTADSVTGERRVQRGELDISNRFSSNRIGRLRETMPAYVRTHVSLATSYLSFNTRNVPALRDIRVRRALSMTVDREFITGKLMRAGELPAYSFTPPITAGSTTTPARLRWAGMSFPARQAEAKRLLAEAGYGPGHPLKLEIKAANSLDTLLLMEAIQADWRLIGVEVSLVQNEGQVVFAAYRARDFQIGSMSWYADFNDPVTFLGLMRSDTGAQNYGDYDNPAYDALMDAADREPDMIRRAELLRQAEQLMLDDEATIPIMFTVNRNLVSPKISGWIDNAENRHRARWLCVAK
ncbi:peptide ABC transporter substrate-binding protein [Phenylobacterium immobile]|uniref:peptide ABC transporter substrate-binding protein n=1 Tax=Phenylobacterium immobile TaxID=21 RepID=UPI000A602611|nr:peptide ABC transporter substrate-binding protein [Phenylobacterium immobile]